MYFKKSKNNNIEGPWRQLGLDLANLDKNIKASYLYGIRKWAERYIKAIKGHIINQDLGWAPKKRPNNDPRTLVDSELYLRNIITYQKSYERYVGIREGVVGADGKTPIKYYAWVHERRSENGGPWRGLWGVTYQEFGGKDSINMEVAQIIYNKIKTTNPALSQAIIQKFKI